MGAVPARIAGPFSQEKPEVRCKWLPPDVEASVDFPANDPRWFRHLPSGSNLTKRAAMSEIVERKKQLRNELRRKRLAHAAELPAEVSALVFNRPPTALLDLVPADA